MNTVLLASKISVKAKLARGMPVMMGLLLGGCITCVRTFVTSVVLFTVASVLCGIFGNMTELILFRALPGSRADRLRELSLRAVNSSRCEHRREM